MDEEALDKANLRIAELESESKQAKIEYQRICDKLGKANRRHRRTYLELGQVKRTIWEYLSAAEKDPTASKVALYAVLGIGEYELRARLGAAQAAGSSS